MLKLLLNYIHEYCDAPRPWGLYFQDSAAPQMEGLVELHDNIMFYLIIILFGVSWVLTSVIRNYASSRSPISHKYLNHGTLIELVWTITPALILILIAFPSFKLLYLMDEVSDPAMSVLAEGHQWYWSYQYSDFLNDDNESIEFDSYMIPEDDLEDGGLRMLEVDNRVILPELTHVRFVVTAADVIHAFACPALGIKADAYPGRLNQVSVLINREGVFYGQCSELCGVLHSAMPIVIESVSLEKFLTWLEAQSLVLFIKNHVSRSPVLFFGTRFRKLGSSFRKVLGGFNFKRYISTTRTLREEEFKDEEKLALDILNSHKAITSDVINSILRKQYLEVSEEKLKELLEVKGVEFDLPITKATQPSFSSMVGKSTYSGGFFGLYIFTHIATNKSYVGSSNCLVRRMDYYFNGKYPLAGKFLPFLHSEGLQAFKLKIYKLNSKIFKPMDALILEQYHLLSNRYELNTLKVVNVSPQYGKSVYIYDLTLQTLYYAGVSQISLKRKLGIHTETSAKYTDTKIPYLGRFILLSFLIPTAKQSNLSEAEFLDLLSKERKVFLEGGSRTNLSIVLKKTTSLDNKLQEASNGVDLNFPSLTSCILYFKSIGITIKRDTLSKYVKTGKEFLGYTGELVSTSGPIDSPYLDGLLEQHSKRAVEDAKVKVNKTNKAILVKCLSDGSTQEFPSIMEGIRHFDALGIKFDRKYLSRTMAEGKPYKGYIFSFK